MDKNLTQHFKALCVNVFTRADLVICNTVLVTDLHKVHLTQKGKQRNTQIIALQKERS